MPQKKKPNNKFRAKLYELRNYITSTGAKKDITHFDFKFDLRQQTDDNLTLGQKQKISRAYNQLKALENLTGGLPVEIIMPRKLKNETPKKYKARIKRIQKSLDQSASSLNVISVPVISGEKVKVVGDSTIKIRQRVGSDMKITQYDYPISDIEKIILLENPSIVLKNALNKHQDLYPEHSIDELLIGMDSNGYVWKMSNVENLSYLAEDIYSQIVKYKAIGDTGAIVGKVIIRLKEYVSKQAQKKYKDSFDARKNKRSKK